MNTPGKSLLIIPFIIFFSLSPLYAQTSSYNKVAKFIAQNAVSQKKMKVAVLTYVPLGGKNLEEGEIISEEIIVELVNTKKVSVVERSQVAKLLKELQFNQTGVVDAAAAKKIGNGLGADALVIGSFTKLNERQIKLFTKLVDTETFQVLGASQDIIGKESGRDEKTFDSDQDKEGITEVLINRRVLILDFVNINESPNYKYLEKSIPESFLASLDKTKKFEIMDRSIWTDALKAEKYEKKDADNEKMAVQLGRQNGADVVLIGSFVVMGSQMQIFAKAIELSSKRVMVSRNVNNPLDNTVFNAINKLTTDMSYQMTEKLPPLPQKIITIEREKYVLDQAITYGSMIWRTAAIPGWGHLYAHEWRGWVYMPLWAGSLGTFLYGVIDYAIKNETYLNANSGLEAAYAEMRDARLVRNISFVSLLGIYTVSVADILIFGKKYEKTPALTYNYPVRFYALILPEAGKNEYNSTRGVYVHFGASTKF